MGAAVRKYSDLELIKSPLANLEKQYLEKTDILRIELDERSTSLMIIVTAMSAHGIV